jgi:ketopantoate reductase
MLLDAEKGQPIEVEVILGEVVRMAKERQVDMPVSITPPIMCYTDRLGFF